MYVHPVKVISHKFIQILDNLICILLRFLFSLCNCAEILYQACSFFTFTDRLSLPEIQCCQAFLPVHPPIPPYPERSAKDE